MGQRLQRPAAKLLVGRGQIDEVDGVEEERHSPAVKALLELRQLFCAWDSRAPHAGIGDEDLHSLGSDAARPLRHGDKAPGSRDLGADERKRRPVLVACLRLSCHGTSSRSRVSPALHALGRSI